MENTSENTLQKISFWLALLIHFLILLGFSIAFIPRSQPEENKAEYIPSYAYQEEAKAVAQTVKATKELEVQPTSKEGILKPVQPKPQPVEQMVKVASGRSSEPVHLLGEKGVPQPLIVILGKALTRHLSYPRIAVDLNVQGTAVIGFVLHPDGKVTDVQLLKTSTADVLDKAALAAANHISPVSGVGPYVSEPKPIVFGIVFGRR